MDHYNTLGVNKTATPEEIKRAYRKLASQHHPDKGGDTVMFQKVEEAYRILSDPEKRAQYDNPPPQGFNQGFPGGFQFHADPFNMNDLFGQIFGQRGPQAFNGKVNHQVFRTQVSVSLEDAYHGANHVLKLSTPTGVKVINIDIPKGLQENSQMRYDNVLDNNAVLLVEFRIMPHLKFERRGNDLHCNHSISVLDLIVGTKFEFTTISNKTLEVAVQHKTQPWMQLKIPGQGMPILGTGKYGDQIISLKPFIPTTIDQEITDSILRHTKK